MGRIREGTIDARVPASFSGVQDPYGPELVTDGDMSNASAFTLSGDSAISGGVLDFAGSANNSDARQALSLTIGKPYLISFRVVSLGGVGEDLWTVGFEAASGKQKTFNRLSLGLVSRTIIAGANGSGFGLRSTATVRFGGTLTDLSVREVLL